METGLTTIEQEFLKYLKKELFFSRIRIETKVPLKDLCNSRSDVSILFGNEIRLIENIVIDFVLYKNDKPLAGIEIVDEPDELLISQGEKMLKETIFFRLGYEFFCFEDLNDLKAAAHSVKVKLSEKERNRT